MHLPCDGIEEKNKGDGKEFLEESKSMENSSGLTGECNDVMK